MPLQAAAEETSRTVSGERLLSRSIHIDPKSTRKAPSLSFIRLLASRCSSECVAMLKIVVHAVNGDFYKSSTSLIPSSPASFKNEIAPPFHKLFRFRVTLRRSIPPCSSNHADSSTEVPFLPLSVRRFVLINQVNMPNPRISVTDSLAALNNSKGSRTTIFPSGGSDLLNIGVVSSI
jgi:hypothetical protein